MKKIRGGVAPSCYAKDYMGNERRDLGLVDDYYLRNGMETLVYSSDGIGYARTSEGDFVTSIRIKQVSEVSKERLSLREIRQKNFQNVMIGAARSVYDTKLKNINADYSSVNASMSAPLLGTVGFEMGGSVGVDKEKNVYASMSVGGGAGVGLGVPVSVGVTHQNFINLGEKEKSYTNRIEGFGYKVGATLFGISQGRVF